MPLANILMFTTYNRSRSMTKNTLVIFGEIIQTMRMKVKHNTLLRLSCFMMEVGTLELSQEDIEF